MSSSGPVDQLVEKTKQVVVGDNQPSGGSSKKSKSAGSSSLKIDPPPEYIQHRQDLFDRLKKEYDTEVANKPREQITVTLPSGDTRIGTSWETSPAEIASQIKKSLPDSIVIAKVDGALWDLNRPLEKSCTLELFDFDSPEGKRVFWHSSAHVLGEAAELHYGSHLCIGPPTTEGFFYEMAIQDRNVTSADYPNLETLAKDAIKQKQPFERLEISKENLLEMFKHNPFKQHIIKDKIPDGTSTTVYRCGPLIDLCVGPHVPHTGRVKSFAVMKNSASYFLGDSANAPLQRIYGISFPDNKQMAEYKTFLAEAAKRDHRRIGREQELFFFNDMSPGSCFFLPHGTRIYNTLVNLMKSEYHKRGYSEVMTPNMFNSKLWTTSGHWQNYAENMFTFDVEKEKFALKPMNCPGHCLMFKNRDRSYRELPWRVADFGVIHRNEFSGALSGLTRVRRFCQDDAHIFCTTEQVADEILGCFDLLKHIYGIFGFTFKLELSTRPEKFLGEIEQWNTAEAQLESALNQFGVPWELNPGDGAFYGPKIDITISDALKREHQCATLQLDFQLPERFELEYTAGDTQPRRPVMIHRAILGSVERMIAILTEHYAGKWPFWLSPRQVMIVPVAQPFYDYANTVQSQLHDVGFFAETDTSDNTLPKKVRTAQLHQWNYILIVGQDEVDKQSVNVRKRDTNTKELVPVDAFIQRLQQLSSSRSLS